jgi:translation initiation factor IF-1
LNVKEKFKIKGEIVEMLPGAKFRVKIKLGEKEHEIIAYISGKMRMNYIKLQTGDEVEVEMTPYDLNKGRIIYRV